MDSLMQILSESLGVDVAAAVFTPKSALVLVAVLVVSIGAYLSMTAKSAANNKGGKTTKDKPAFTPAGPAPENDVWAERRKRGIAPHACNASKTKEPAQVAEKPFGSSYYYAHNNSNAKGGYSDGLRMEDFTMNGPRLLSKNGMTVSQEQAPSSEEKEENPATTSEQPTTTNSQETRAKIPETSCTLITKYLWDDPGDASGVATIRIDTLPDHKIKNNTLDWKDAKIVDVKATLEGEGLLVIATDENKHEYRLQINRLYDKATEVRTVVKAKRLLVKIHKRRGGHLNFLGKSNIEAWPHPQRK